MNEGRWRTTDLAATRDGDATLVRGADQSLTDSPARAAGEDDYVVDFSASSGDTTRWQTNLTGGDVYYPDRAEEDTAC